MTEASDAPFEPRTLPCHTIVYRAIRSSRKWIDQDTKELLPFAFHRRKDEKGLSVLVSPHVPNEEECCRLAPLNKCHGVDSLHVGWVRDLGLDVEQDTPTHADIIGMPVYTDGDGDSPENIEADRIATRLASISRTERRRA